MIAFQKVLSSEWVQHWGWTLVHSLWQMTIIAVFAAFVLGCLHRRSANLRYVVACVTLAAMFLSLPVTYCVTSKAADRALLLASTPTNVSLRLMEPSVGATTTAGDSRPVAVAALPDPSPAGAESHRSSSLPDLATRLFAPCIPWTVFLWWIGVMGLSTRRLGGYVAAARLRYVGVMPAPESLAQSFRELRERLAVTQSVRLVQSILVEVPVAIGWVRPAILVPVGMLTGLSAHEIDAILAHELAHARRCDFLVNLLQTVAETLLFYHPAVWWVSRRIRIEREHCCDDMAVVVCGSNVDYAKALIAIEKSRSAPEWAMAATGGKRAGATLGRVRRILGVPASNQRHAVDWAGGVILLALVSGLAICIPFSLAAPPAKPAPANSEPMKESDQSAGKPAIADGQSDSGKRAKDSSSRGVKPKIVGGISISASFRIGRSKPDNPIVLQGYDLLMQPAVVKDLKITADQKNRLHQVQSAYYADVRKFYQQRRKLPQDEVLKAFTQWQREQWSDTRKQVEKILTPKQTETLNDFVRQTKAFDYLSNPNPRRIEKLRLTDEQQRKLSLFQEEENHWYRQEDDARTDKMLAVLTAPQREQLRKEAFGPLWPDSHPQWIIEIGGDVGKIYVPADPYPDLTREDVGKQLGLGPEQRNQVREALGGASDLAEKLVEEWRKLRRRSGRKWSDLLKSRVLALVGVNSVRTRSGKSGRLNGRKRKARPGTSGGRSASGISIPW